MKQKFDVTGMTCGACVAHVEKAVKKLPGVQDVAVSLMTTSMQVEYDDSTLNSDAISAAVSAAGSGADECLPAAADRSGSSRSAMNSCLRCTIRRLIQLQSNGIISEAAILICEEALRVRRPRHIRPSWRRLPARPPSECPAFP